MNLLEMLIKNSIFPVMSYNPNINTNQRKIERFATKTDCLHAMMSWCGCHGFIFPVQMIDINEKGCGMYYVTEKVPLTLFEFHEKCNLKFIGQLKMCVLVDNTVIYDNEITAYSTERISVRRCGICFMNP